MEEYKEGSVLEMEKDDQDLWTETDEDEQDFDLAMEEDDEDVDLATKEDEQDLDLAMEEDDEDDEDVDLEMVGNQDFQMEVDKHMEFFVPKVGMIFDFEDAARQFFATHARAKGFGVSTSNCKRIDGRKTWVSLDCHHGGVYRKKGDAIKSKPTAKTNCKASMKMSRQKEDDKWKVNTVHLEHNHDMNPKNSRYLRCYRNLPAHVQREIELNCGAGIKMNKTVRSIERRGGGDKVRTWMEKDARNHMIKVRKHQLKGGDAAAMMQYFQRMQAENNDFFYCIDVDENKCLTKVFWADARSREAYKEFGDAVTFDTTYLVNRFNMPFAPFVGVNHHGHSCLFGCGLVTQEDTASFVWLFKAWLDCMSNCHPKAIITDQNRAMQNAIKIVFPNTRHRWFLWHIMKKVPEKFKGNKEYEKIQYKISNTVYDSLTTQEFEQQWARFIERYNLEDNCWLRVMYDERNRWVPAFVKDTFWAGLSTTQRSESINAFFDGYVHSKTTLKEFVEQYENALRKKVQKEEEADAMSMNSQYPHASPYIFECLFHEAYTASKFKDFWKQVAELIACELEVGHVVDGIQHFVVEHSFEVTNKKEKKFIKTVKYTVWFNEETGETSCICRMFECKGMVCVHMLRIWKWKKLSEESTVPERYILHRWRKNVVRSHTKVRLSYTNWQCKPEWGRYDELREIFDEAADGVIFFIDRTDWFKGILAQVIEANKAHAIEIAVNKQGTNMPLVIPTSINVQLVDQSTQGQSIIVGDPSQGTKRGRPETLRKLSHFDKAAKKKAKASKKKQDTNGGKMENVAAVFQDPNEE